MPDVHPTAHITAAVIEPALDQALDLHALEQRERDLIHRPDTPEADSVVELLGATVTILNALGVKVAELARLNGMQLDIASDLAGWGDRLVATLRDAERNENAAPLTGRALARHLIPLLDTLTDNTKVGRWPQARADLEHVFARVPADVIFRHAVTYHLGDDRTRECMMLHRRWTRRRGKAA